MAAMLAGGLATHQISPDPMREAGISQFFLAIDPSTLAADGAEERDAIADAILASVHGATPVDPTRPPRYPGEETVRVRQENLRLGVPVDEDVWKSFTAAYLSPCLSAQ